MGQTYKFSVVTIISGAFVYLKSSTFGCDNILREHKIVGLYRMCSAYFVNTRMISMFIYDIMCRREGVSNPIWETLLQKWPLKYWLQACRW